MQISIERPLPRSPGVGRRHRHSHHFLRHEGPREFYQQNVLDGEWIANCDPLPVHFVVSHWFLANTEALRVFHKTIGVGQTFDVLHHCWGLRLRNLRYDRWRLVL